MNNLFRIRNLLKKITHGVLNSDEAAELSEWVKSEEGRKNIDWLCRELDVPVSRLLNVNNEHLRDEKYEDLIQNILQIDKKKEAARDISIYMPIKRKPYLKYAAAIILLTGLSAVLFYLSGRSRIGNEVKIVSKENKVLIVPGKNKAVLTLSNGVSMSLDSINTGTVIQDARHKIIKSVGGSLTYTSVGSDKKSENTGTNTLSTPRGGQYTLELSDGTKVWLNAASQITYPIAFTGEKREVSIKGEVYFEVAHNAAKPFIVKTDNDMKVEVLGTHFDINAYTDEKSIKTTLLEGSVKVTSLSDQKMLKPREQMQLLGDNKLKLTKDIEVESIMGWKDGVFNFNEADISSVMRQLSRWYDIDVVYNGTIPQDHFTAIISRNNNIDQVLTMLESTLRVHFNIQNRTIYVSN